MGRFYDQIKDELDALAPAKSARSSFGADYDSNPTVVKQVQAAINAAGYAPALTVDGSYGPLTAAGVKWAQGQNGLAQDGIIGDQTLGALGITPPTGTSIQSAVGTIKGAGSAALQALQSEYAQLLSWAQNPTNAQPITQGSGVAPGFQATKASVVSSYVDWTIPFEGWVAWMYLDELGYVTTGMGNKIDSIGEAQALPWTNASGGRASAAEIAAAWQAVDGHRTAAKGQQQNLPGGGAQAGWSSLRISKTDVQTLVAQKMKQNESYILSHMPSFAEAPADAQLAIHSMSWAMGPAFTGTWTAFDEAFAKGDYQTASDQSHMKGTGIDMRNMANKLLLANAAQVRAKGYSPDHLYYLDFAQLFTSGPLALLAKIPVPSPTAIIASVKAHPYRTGGIAAVVIAIVTGLWYVFMPKGGQP